MSVLYFNNFDSVASGATPAGWTTNGGLSVFPWSAGAVSGNVFGSAGSLGDYSYWQSNTNIGNQGGRYSFKANTTMTTDNEAGIAIVLRNQVAADSMYRAYVLRTTAGALYVRVLGRAGGSMFDVWTDAALTANVGDTVHFEFTAIGNVLEARTWINSNPRPTTPTYTRTDNTFATGGMGLYRHGTFGVLAGIDELVFADGASGLDYFYPPASGPTINTQPTNQTVVSGQSATLSLVATASGGSLTYQWQRSTDGGTNFLNVTTGTGGTTGTYNTGNTTVSGGTANNGDRYRCQVTDSNGTTISTAVTLTVNAAATAVTLTGPTSGTVNVASTNFTVSSNGALTGSVVVTPSDGGAGGTFTPTAVTISSGSPSITFTYTPSSAGAKTISVTNNSGLSNPANITYTASASAATALSMSGPSSGSSGVASTNFTVSTNGTLSGTVTVTPSDGGNGGTFNPTTLTLNSGTLNATFTYTPASGGNKTISITNNGGLSNPSNLTYVSNAQGSITTATIKNNTGTPLASIDGWYINVYNPSSGVLVLHKTNISSNSSAVISFTDAALTPGTTYTYELGHATYGRRLPTLTAS